MQRFRHFIELGFIDMDLFTWSPDCMFFKVHRIYIRAMATICLRKIVDSFASFIFLPEDVLKNTKLLQSEGPQQQL